VSIEQQQKGAFMNSKVQLAMFLSLALFSSSIVVGCATGNKELNTKLSQETEVKKRSDLGQEATGLIASNPKLTNSQKTQLFALRDSVKAQMDQIQSDSLKLRAVLIREVLSPNYSSKEARLIERRMAKLDSKRTSVILNTIDEANRILGRMDELDREEFLFDLMENRDQMRGEL